MIDGPRSLLESRAVTARSKRQPSPPPVVARVTELFGWINNALVGLAAERPRTVEAKHADGPHESPLATLRTRHIASVLLAPAVAGPFSTLQSSRHIWGACTAATDSRQARTAAPLERAQDGAGTGAGAASASLLAVFAAQRQVEGGEAVRDDVVRD